jgi:phage terminase large subunit GpA-like protein
VSDAAAIREIRKARADGIRPDAVLSVSEWADQHRRLPKKSSAEPGPWRTDRTPYLREIMDCFSSRSDVEEVVFMSAAQIGKTEALLNALGYFIDHAPGPIMLVWPDLTTAKRGSRQRVGPLITDTPKIAEKIAPAKSRDSANTVLEKSFTGGHLVIAGAQSAAALRSMPAQYALMDEIDAWPIDVEEEGSPIALVEARQRTFARRKRGKFSTPTIAGRSAIEAAHERGDARKYFVPCPMCGAFQTLEFSRLVWTKLELPPAAAVYECEACGGFIRNHQKSVMLAAGEWRATNPGRGAGKIRSYHLNALYAPVGWISWGEIATEFVEVEKDPEKFRVFVNTVLGEVWKSKGEAPEWENLYRRREAYATSMIPPGALVLTAGVDVQKDRLVYEIVGWGRGKRSWSIDAGEIAGDTDDLERGPWPQLDAMMARTYPHAEAPDVEQPIRVVAVDSQYRTQTVYTWAKKYPGRAFPIRGVDHGASIIGTPQAIEVTISGKKRKRGGRQWPIAVGIVKSELYGWLRLELQKDGTTPPGYVRYPEYPEEWFRQITAEQLTAHKTRRGYIRLEWEVIKGRQNHALDARVYARAAAVLAGVDRTNDRDWEAREKFLGVGQTPAAAAAAARPRTAPPASSSSSSSSTPEPEPTPPAPPPVPPPAPLRPGLVPRPAPSTSPAPAPPRPPGRPAWVPSRPDWLKKPRP